MFNSNDRAKYAKKPQTGSIFPYKLALPYFLQHCSPEPQKSKGLGENPPQKGATIFGFFWFTLLQKGMFVPYLKKMENNCDLLSTHIHIVSIYKVWKITGIVFWGPGSKLISWFRVWVLYHHGHLNSSISDGSLLKL